MNTDDFISSLSEKTGRDADDTARLVSSLTDIIVGGIQDGKAVSLQGFGIFEVKKRPEKIVANPTTGKRILYPPKLVIGFRPSSLLKEKINSTEKN